MTFKMKYGTYEGAEFKATRYGNGNLALAVESETEGPICICSVNPGQKVDDGLLAVKDYSENEGMASTLLDMGIIGEKKYSIPSGWVSIPVYELTEKGLALWGLSKESGR